MALAAKKPAGDRFGEYHTKQLSAGGPIKLEDNAYAKLTAAPRDYYVAVLLTALEARFGCGLCQEFQPEWNLLAKSWTKGDKKGQSRLVFGTLDFVDGKDTFQSVLECSVLACGPNCLFHMQLQLQTAPVLLLFHPTTGPDAKADGQPTRFDFNTG